MNNSAQTPRTVTGLKGLVGTCQGFHAELQKLKRPYIPISEAQYEKLMGGKYDYYLTNSGQVVTYGYVDQGYALMPLQDSFASSILAHNGGKHVIRNQARIN